MIEPDIQEKLNVLFVDDEPENTAVIQRTLRRFHNIFTANSGDSALEIIKNEKIDIILADQRMPNMTGVQFLEKSISIKPDIYRVLLTGYADIHAMVDAINKCSVHSYLTKPWTKETLLNEIDCARPVNRKKNTLRKKKLSEKYNILLVDDEPANIDVLTRALLKQYNLFKAYNGLEALEILKNNTIEIAIVDQRMPLMAGNTFLGKSKEINPNLLKILITAFTDAEVIINAINVSRVDKFLYKPFNAEDIRALLEDLIAKKSEA